MFGSFQSRMVLTSSATESDPGTDPENAVVYTIGTSGDYASLNDALAGAFSEYPDQISSDVILIFRYVGDWSGGSDATSVTWPDFDQDADHYIQIDTDSANAHNGLPDSSKAIWENISFNSVQTDYVHFVRMQIYGLSRGVATFGVECLIDECIVSSPIGANSIPVSSGSSVTLRVRSSVIFGGRYGFVTGDANSDGYAYNCSVYCSRNPFWNNGGMFTVKNCIGISDNPATYDVYLGTFEAESDYNSGNDATAPGVNSIDSISNPFVDSANGDLHITGETSGLTGGGINLSEDVILPVISDIDGNSFLNPPSIGAHEAG